MALYHSRVYRADKNHNPRKGTETLFWGKHRIIPFEVDKNHNPRKGTDKKSSLIFVFSFFVENFDEVSPHTRDFSHELGGT